VERCSADSFRIIRVTDFRPDRGPTIEQREARFEAARVLGTLAVSASEFRLWRGAIGRRWRG